MLRFYTAGESHGQALLAFISGLPASLPVDLEFINHELHRRQLGYGRGGRQKIEKDRADIFAGVRHGQTIGAPIALRIENRDWANWEKILPVEGSRRCRERQRHWSRLDPGMPTSPARKNSIFTTRGTSWSARRREKPRRAWPPARSRSSCCANSAPKSPATPSRSATCELDRAATWDEIRAVNADLDSPLRCIDAATQEKMKAEVDNALKAGDTVGGVFEVVAHNVPVGLGSHAQWDEKLDGRLAQALMSIQAVKGVEIGAGITAAGSYGSEVQDEISYDQTPRASAAPRIAPADSKAASPTAKTSSYAAISSRSPPCAAPWAPPTWSPRSPSGGLRALRLVRGARGRRRRRSHDRTCAGRCFSGKIWRRLACRDAAEFR